MPNSNRALSLNSRGADVQELQSNLVQLGFVIPQHELAEQVFGVATKDAVLTLQGKYGLPAPASLMTQPKLL